MTSTGEWGGQQVLGCESEKHQRIVDALKSRKRQHETATTNLRQRWQRDEEQYIGYINEAALDTAKKASRRAGVPDQATIHIPYNYAMLMAAHTYMTSVLFARDPIWQVKGRHGETQDKEQVWEALLNYQTIAGKHVPSYYVWTHDSLRYGFGVQGQYWCKDTVNVTQITEAAQTFWGIPIPGKTRKVTIIQNVPSYQGIKCYNVRPHDFGWDARYPVGRFQEGEYCFRHFEMSSLDILYAKAPGDKPRYFNLDRIERMTRGGGSGSNTLINDTNNTVLDIPKQENTEAGYTLEVVNLPCDEFYVRLNPRVWGLPGPDRIEKWVFLLVDESTIISAQPLGLMHDMFPFAITQNEVEGYDRAPRSVLHTTEGLNEILVWLVNSHLTNVRAALNDKYIVDPQKIVMNDLTGPNAGRIIRLKPEYQGGKLGDIIQQVPTADVTRTNIQDFSLIADIMQRASGVNDTQMGAVNTGRRTATEVRSSTTLGINRQKTNVEFNSACAFDPHVMMMIATTQQMMDFEVKLRIAGDLARTADQFVTADPAAIAGFFDFIPVDGTLPIDRMAQVNIWTQLLGMAAQVPQVAMGYDIGGIFGFVAQLAGIRNINRYKLAPGLTPNVNVLGPGQAPPSNVVPMARGLDNSGAPTGPQPGPQQGQVM